MSSAVATRGFDATLPRLLYVADVPVENTFHGSAVIHRLLEGFPPGWLRIVETCLMSGQKGRLPNVDYRHIPVFGQRLLSTRFFLVVACALLLGGAIHLRSLVSACGVFEPEAVLT